MDPTTRPKYIPGRCGAWANRKAPFHQWHPCRAYPMVGAERCKAHGGRGLNGGWLNGHRKGLDGIPYRAEPQVYVKPCAGHIKRLFNRAAKKRKPVKPPKRIRNNQRAWPGCKPYRDLYK